MKRRAFFFTISVISLAVLMLLTLSLYQQVKLDPAPFLLSEKMTYSWEDVSEDLSGAAGVNVTKIENSLRVIDEFPAPRNFSSTLATYASFVQRFYNGSDVSIGFYSSTGQAITDFSCFGKRDCGDATVQFHILPFNITYQYPDLNKRELDVACYEQADNGFPACDFSHVRALNISINLTAMNFSCDPAFYNNCTHSNLEWNNDFDKVFGCTSGAGCINYTLTIRDNSSRVYSCGGVYGANSGNTRRVNCNASTLSWLENNEAVLSIKSSPCQIDLRFGNDGRFRVQSSAPASGNCNVNMSIDSLFTFDTSDFWADFSTEMLVRDSLANYSVRTAIR